LLAAVLTAVVWRVFDDRVVMPASTASTPGGAAIAQPVQSGTMEITLLTIAYGIAGIGYIVTATFLPVIARQALPGSHWLDLFWPLFGAGVMVGAVGASRLRSGGDLRIRLAWCYVLQSLGVAASLVSPTLAGFAIGSLLLGVPFTAITFFAMQEVRRIRPVHTTSFMGILTATYGVGQIIGPPLAAWLVARSTTPARGFTTSLWIASGSLALGAALYVLLARRYPATR
jgi:MFS family permease